MSRFHYDTVVNAVKYYAFNVVENLDNHRNLPYQEPPFRFITPGTTLVSKDGLDDTVWISKKPEGNREIFVCLYDKVDKTVHLYSMDRHKQIKYILPESKPYIVPILLNDTMEQVRHQSVQERLQNGTPSTLLNVMFVFDICRVYSPITRGFYNVLLSDLGPIQLNNLSDDDRNWFKKTYGFVEKYTKKYESIEDIREVTIKPEIFPYHPENGVIFVQGKKPIPKSPCAKWTEPENASVYLHVLPVLTKKTNIWKLSYYNNDTLELFKTIPAFRNFYIPPIGCVVSFGIEFEGRIWKLVPKHIRQDKLLPSSHNTITRFINRYRQRNNISDNYSDHDDHDDEEENKLPPNAFEELENA